jgi:hypothetical protein
VAFVKCFLSMHESGDGQDSQNGKSSSILWPRHSMMLPVTVLRLCCANALAAAFLHSNDPASALTMVGLLDILCSTNFLPSESALLQKSLAHDTKQAVLTNPHNLLSNDTMLKTWSILVCLHKVQSGRKYMHL